MNVEQARDYLANALVKENAPNVVLLYGDLGAGKTHFVNTFAQLIGVPQRLPSPTFTFLQEYNCEWMVFKKIIHCDFYRIEKEKSSKLLEQIGFWDYILPSNMIFIEWPERAPELLELPHYSLTITLLNNERTYEFT